MKKSVVGIVLAIIMVCMGSVCSAQIKVYCFFDTSNDEFQWFGAHTTKYCQTLYKESYDATNGEIVFINNADVQEMLSSDWYNGLSLSEMAQKHGYKYVMKIFVMKPTEDLVHFRTARYQKDYYDVLGIPMVCVLADPWEDHVVGPGPGGTRTHGLLSRENGWYVSFINQIRGLLFSVGSVTGTRNCVNPNLESLTEDEERLIEKYGKYW